MLTNLFLCRQRTNGYLKNTYGLVNSAQFMVNYFNSKGVPSAVETAKDANDIDRFVTGYDAKNVFIEALWVTPAKLKEILSLKRHKCRNWIIRIHSQITFLANEGIAVDWLNGYKELQNCYSNLFVAPNDKSSYDYLKEVLDLRALYLPNMYLPLTPTIEPKNIVKSDTIKVGCFGAIRPMKNTLAQAFVASAFAKEQYKKLEFYVNSSRLEQSGEPIYKNLVELFKNKTDQKLIECAWMTYKDFISTIKLMDFGTQTSLTETFNIVAADFISNGVPIIGSSAIEWLSDVLKVEPTDLDELKEKMDLVYNHNFWRKHYVRAAQNNLMTSNKKAAKQWEMFL